MASATRGEAIRVLHVDDDPRVINTVRSVLARDDHLRVVSATDPQRALAHLERSRPDVVVSDYDLPSIDGAEFLHAVRERDADLPFVFFAAADRRIDDAVLADATDRLTKGDAGYAALRERVRTAGRRGAEDQSTSAGSSPSMDSSTRS